NMEPTASLSILALLMLGLTQAVPLMEPQHVDITTRILSTNNGSRELLLEGDIVLPRTRNALVCANNNCFWKKSSTGLVQVPFTVSAVIAGAMATFHSKTCIPLLVISPLCYSPLGRTGGKQHDDRGPLPCLNWPGTSTLQCSTNLQQVETPIQFSTHRTGYYSGRDLLIYGKAAFPINGLNTITPIPDHQSQIGDSRFWTWPIIDIQRINTLYNC
uniref:Peptidase M12A domain-containing protein n=1 Tax=Astyanax mexicanus TaxID=7994 RepID=A0A3B1JAU0_ASTMX